VIIGFAFETKNFSTCTFDTSKIQIINFDTIATVDSSTKLVVSMYCRKLLTYKFLINIKETPLIRKKFL